MTADVRVFGLSGARRRTLSDARELWLSAIVAIAAGVLAFLRLPSSGIDVMWAEDGKVFLADRAASAAWDNVFSVYDGYLHVVPRILSEVVVALVAPTAFGKAVTVLSVLVAALVAAMVFSLTSSLVSWLPARILIAATTVLVPTAIIEALGNMANLHWLFLWATVWVLLGRARSMWGAWTLGVAVLLMAFTEIQMIVFVPLILAHIRDRRRWPVYGGLLIGIGGQIAAYLSDPRTMSGVRVPIGSTVEGYLVQPMMGTLTGMRSLASRLILEFDMVVPVIVFVLGLTAFGFVVWRGRYEQRVLAAALLVGSMGLWAFAFVANPNPAAFYSSYGQDEWAAFVFTRYAYVPSMLFISAFPLAASVLHERGARILPWVVTAAVVIVLSLSFRVEATRAENGPDWSDAIERAQVQCADGRATASIPLAPGDWTAILPCPVLLDSSR